MRNRVALAVILFRGDFVLPRLCLLNLYVAPGSIIQVNLSFHLSALIAKNFYIRGFSVFLFHMSGENILKELRSNPGPLSLQRTTLTTKP